jgi:hypothetical protein
MNKLEKIKSLCDIMTDTKCEIDWEQKVANIDFIGSNGRFRARIFADEAKEDLEDYLEEAKIMIKDLESVVVKLEALLLLKVVKEDKE